MPVTVDPVEIAESDTDLARCTVAIEDATGQVREYDIRLSPDEIADDGYLMAGSRIDDAAPDEPAGGGPSQMAWNAAREHFRDLGFEVHEA